MNEESGVNKIFKLHNCLIRPIVFKLYNLIIVLM